MENPFKKLKRNELASRISNGLKVLNGMATAPTDVVWIFEAMLEHLSGGMADEKVVSAFRACEERLRASELRLIPAQEAEMPMEEQEKYDQDDRPYAQYDYMAGCRALWCAVEGSKLVAEGRREKAMRWLGFVQGVTFALGYCTVEDLKNDSRPEAPVKEGE